MRNFYARLIRYANTWIWLISCNAKLHPALLFLTIFFGVSARLSTILGFVISIKSAVWIFQPEIIPSFFYDFLPIGQQGMFVILILVPGLMFLLTGQLRYSHSYYALKLQTKFSNYSAQEVSLIELGLKKNEEFDERATFIIAASDIKKNYAKLFAIEAMLLDLLILVPVIVISLLVGAFINWLIVGVVMFFGSLLVIVFVWKRHQDRNNLEDLEEELRQEETASANEFYDLHDKRVAENDYRIDVSPKITSLIESISNIRGMNQKFRYNSDFMMDTGQSMVVIVFLALLLNSDVQNMQVEYLVILALLFRFIISYGKAIVQAILKLSPFYKFVVELQKLLDSKA